MSTGITSALITAMVLGLWFNSTRPFSIAAATALTFMYPPLAVLVVLSSVIALYLRLTRK